MISLEKSVKIKFILTRHEQGAAFMAEIYGRLTGNAAGCLGTLGPGATNLITGDAGYLMNVQEMETAKRLNVNIVTMIWEDNMYGLIAWKQQNEFGKHTDLSFANPDWLKLAEAFDWFGHKVENSKEEIRVRPEWHLLKPEFPSLRAVARQSLAALLRH